tara:strand:+ start:349 stop:579 length:231 start_codon:yes stop_codon:yes gene_type:complete
MPIAYVLINTKTGKEENCFNEINKIQNVTSTYLVYGFYDLVVIVETSDVRELNNSLKKIRNNKNVTTTETMPVIES